MTDPEREWSPLDEEAWLARVSAMRIDGTPKDLWLRGPCPGCGHPIARNISPLAGAAFTGGTQSPPIRLRCNCGQPHKGRPDDAWPVGCGAEGGVTINP